MGVTNQELINRGGAQAHQVRRHLRGYRVGLLTFFAFETTGGHGASTASVYFLFNKHMRDSGLPADVLLGKFKRDVSFALRRGTIAQVTTALDAAQRAVEYESALNEADWDR